MPNAPRMKTLALLLASLALAPALFLTARGARLESWPIVAAAGSVLVACYVGIRYLIGE